MAPSEVRMLLKLYPRVHRRYTSLPVLGPILEGFGTWLLNQGYSTDCVREHFCAMRRLARLLRQQGIDSVAELSQTRLQSCASVPRLDDKGAFLGIGRTESLCLKRGNHLVENALGKAFIKRSVTLQPSEEQGTTKHIDQQFCIGRRLQFA
jgi:hypothetical protein